MGRPSLLARREALAALGSAMLLFAGAGRRDATALPAEPALR